MVHILKLARACRILAVIILLMLMPGCIRHKELPYTSSDFIMGTYVTQRIYGENAEEAAKEVRQRLEDIENRMTINAPGGEINNLNEMAGNGVVTLSSDTYYVIREALTYSELSGGAFDITIGPVVKLWGVFSDDARVPEPHEVEEKVKLVNYRDLILEEPDKAKLTKPGQIVDLGAIAKGYGGDEAIRIYKKHGIKSAYINLGGNTVVLGSKPDGSPWRVAIQNPRGENNTYIGIVPVTDKAVVTSGDYERYFEKDGKRYHHIFDPKTGYPAESDLISASVITEKSIMADVLSTAVFVLGLDKGMELIENLEGVEGIFVTREKKVYVSSGLAETFIFDDKSGEFEYVQKR